jgi:hypothetical protein
MFMNDFGTDSTVLRLILASLTAIRTRSTTIVFCIEARKTAETSEQRGTGLTRGETGFAHADPIGHFAKITLCIIIITWTGEETGVVVQEQVWAGAGSAVGTGVETGFARGETVVAGTIDHSLTGRTAVAGDCTIFAGGAPGTALGAEVAGSVQEPPFRTLFITLVLYNVVGAGGAVGWAFLTGQTVGVAGLALSVD